ncbi:MAG TPA: hypothetical protein VGZ00_07020 [Candidatus Baltobacteraceae bacterium]|jgi:hypothetical protein|nr:hypothetical protein [Candidatus Baltobacteraceae bacterium]
MNGTAAVAELLLPGEHVIVEGRKHWAAAWRISLGVGACAYVDFQWISRWLTLWHFHAPQRLFGWAIALLSIVAVAKFISVVTKMDRFRIVVTNHRVFLVHADTFQCTATAVGSDWISSATISQNWLGRLLGYGNFSFRGGTITQNYLATIANPLQLWREMQGVVYAGKTAPAEAPVKPYAVS